jgi:hypothetical protein
MTIALLSGLHIESAHMFVTQNSSRKTRYQEWDPTSVPSRKSRFVAGNGKTGKADEVVKSLLWVLVDKDDRFNKES